MKGIIVNGKDASTQKARIALLLRLARFRKRTRKLPPLEVPQHVKRAAEDLGFTFTK